MRDWMDLNGDGEIDGSEMMLAGEMLCTSREEHEALFGDAGDFEDDTKDDLEIQMTGQRHWKKQDWIRMIMILTEIWVKEADLYEKEFICTGIGNIFCDNRCSIGNRLNG